MNYGMYLSAAGMVHQMHRQDVISANLANAESVGFKRSMALFQERPTAAEGVDAPEQRDPSAVQIAGGRWVSPTYVDFESGALEATGSNLDVAIDGPGFLGIATDEGTRLTRDGRFTINTAGQLAMSVDPEKPVLNQAGQPLVVGNVSASLVQIAGDGAVSVGNQLVGVLGRFDVDDPTKVRPVGGNLFQVDGDAAALRPSVAQVRSGFVERANVDAATELTRLMEAYRLLEANANMIRYQDQATAALISRVGKIS